MPAAAPGGAARTTRAGGRTTKHRLERYAADASPDPHDVPLGKVRIFRAPGIDRPADESVQRSVGVGAIRANPVPVVPRLVAEAAGHEDLLVRRQNKFD